MDHPDRPSRCPRCGSDLPPDRPEGLCPACLLAVASEPLSDVTGAEPTMAPPIGAPGPAQLPPPRLAAGQRFGPYRIERLLGRGGMGEVYEAEHLEQGRRVALKVLSERLTDPQDRARFLREGQLAASISHPNSVYIFGSEEIDGIPVIAMELLPGGTLKDRVLREGPLRPAEAVDAILQIIAGLDAAQAAGILHRDIKPGNCFTGDGGIVKVGDFGLSISTLARDVTQITTWGLFHGTPQFASPEQLRGEPLDVRADIYAVGATLYYLLTGQPPFDERELLPLITRVATDAPRSPRALNAKIPRGLAAIVLQCLAKDRAQRPPTYAALDDALRPFGSAAPSPATLGLRFIAAMIDSFIFGAAFSPLTTYFVLHGFDRSIMLLGGLATTAIFLAYYALLEGQWGASIGKRICGLRVTGPDGQRPGLMRALVRAVIYDVPAMSVYAPVALLSQAHFSQIWMNPRTSWAASAPYYILLVVIFSTARRRNGFAGLHEILTGTRVVRRTARTRARPAVDAVVDRAAAAGRSRVRYGPFDVVGSLGATDTGELLVGFDPSLRRSVWIHVLAPGTPAIAPLYRDLSRPGRLRWLSGRRSAAEAWDAYEALDGAPFVSLAGQSQPWQSARYWLADLAREIDAGLSDASLPTLAFDRAWISRDGHATLLDFRAPGVQSVGQPETAATFTAAQVFLGAFARRAIEGPDAGGAGRRQPLPLSANKLLATLSAHGLTSPQDLVARVTGLTSHTGRVETWRRAAHIAMCAAPPLFLTLTAVVVAPLMMQRMFTPDIKALSICLSELSAIPVTADEAAGRRRQTIEVYIAGRFGSMIANADVSPNPMVAGMLAGRRAQVDRIFAAHPHVSSEETARAGAELGPWLAERQQETDAFSSSPNVLVILAIYFSMMAFFGVLSAWIFRGGWLLRALGIAVITNRGDEASRLRTLWRGLVAWSPAVAAAYGVMHASLRSSLPATTRDYAAMTLAVVMGALFALGAAFTALNPERGWQDRFAGTWLVPR